MELKKGYKMTEVGVIPEDWMVSNLSDYIHIGNGQVDPKTDENKRKILIAPNHIESGTGRLIYTETSEEQGATSGKYNVKNGEIIYSKIRPYLRKAIIAPFNCLCSADMYPISTSTNLDTNYCFTILLGDRFTRFASAQSARTGIPKINREELLNFVFPLPTLTEQRAIATALSDVDRLLSAYDQLIAKKKGIKQGAMQELLTGKRRLEGFRGEWEVKTVSELGEVVTGGTPSTLVKGFWNGDIPWVTPTDIGDAKNISITSRQISLTGLKSIRSLPTNTLLVTCIASIGKNAILRKAGGCNQQINAVIPYDHHSVDFIYYLIENSKNYILGKAGMTATSIVSKKEFSSLEFLIPSSLEEQRAIAQILTDMDAEITALEQQRDKYKAVKQGMMQELLTGKTRLI